MKKKGEAENRHNKSCSERKWKEAKGGIKEREKGNEEKQEGASLFLFSMWNVHGSCLGPLIYPLFSNSFVSERM